MALGQYGTLPSAIPIGMYPKSIMSYRGSRVPQYIVTPFPGLEEGDKLNSTAKKH